MNGSQDDPFNWDEEQVAQMLGAANCPWSRDPASVAVKAREELIDGATLLKFEHTIPRQEFMDCLGIKLTRHKSALTETIFRLQSVSKGYYQWKQKFDQQQSGFQEDPETSAENGPSSALEAATQIQAKDLQPPKPEVRSSRGNRSPIEDNDPYSPKLEAQPSEFTPLPNPSPSNNLETRPSSGGIEPSMGSSPSLPIPNAVRHTEHGSDKERASKRRRVVPITMSTRPLGISSAFLPTEADNPDLQKYLEPSDDNNGLPWESAPRDAYLGDGGMSKSSIKSPFKTLSTRIVDFGDGAFTTLLHNHLPPGRRITVYNRTKRLLLKNSRKEGLLKDEVVLMRSPTPSEDEHDDDKLVDFDLLDDFDEETQNEIAKEKAEQERSQGLGSRSLSREQVEAILDEAIEEMTRHWEETKLLKYRRKAHRQWHAAKSRVAGKKQKVLKAREDAKLYNDRIKRLRGEILDQTWHKSADVRNQARILEQNLEDQLYNTWFAEMLDSRNPPPKPDTVPRPRRPTIRELDDTLEEEILDSSDEDDFVVPDDESGLYDGEPMDITHDSALPDPGSPSPSIKEESTYVDLTQLDTPVKASRSQQKPSYIDLTSPMKSQDASDHSPIDGNQTEVDLTVPSQTLESFLPPPLDKLGSMEQIGNVKEDYWANENDRWRLAICMIYKLPHARRTALLELVHGKPLDDIWKESVHTQLSTPLTKLPSSGAVTSAVTAFDLTRVFLSFTKCKLVSISKTGNMSKKHKRRLGEARPIWFEIFCRFIDDAAGLFPQDSQIYRMNDPAEFSWEDSDEENLLFDGEDTQSQRRKPIAKEIIQNKEAVDLREREFQRQREQEARRQVLRARVANFLPRDQTRLIINESKREDQPFVYVNEDIGRQIMDHQVDGVRFLWNQVILDAKTRQGCLLAHTMGLGKTMQVITLLTAIAETAQSEDEAMSAQIPPDLRKSQTLILCPAPLVDNWMDELLMWAPEGVLGQLRKISATTPPEERLPTVEAWATGGGILVIGYPMIKQVLSNSAEAKRLIIDKPNIVVADEAHKMKNKKTNIHAACQGFRTKTRIALTGSPLANHVGEYYVMIDWVAPNFLGPEAEFREVYAKPIQEGLTVDSTRGEQRVAIKKLQALKETVAPKVNRMTVNECLKDVLPQKHEFVISVPPTPLQSKLYASYIDCFMQDYVSGPLFAKVNSLGLICNHPRCFQKRIKEVQEKMGAAANPNEVLPSFPKSVIQPALKELQQSNLTDIDLSYKTKLLTIILDEARKAGDKVLVFTQSIPTLEYLADLFKMQKRKVYELSGKTPIASRQNMTKMFNTGNQEVYLVSTTAGGEGLNLQGANRVVIFDFKYNPVHDQQAVGRAYRIGQSKEVYVYRFVVAGSFEEDLQNRHVFKTQLASRVVDKKNPISWGKRKGDLFHHIEDRPVTDLGPFLGKDIILDKLIQCQNSIRSIVSTDTFEEEEPTVELTQAERQEVDELVFRLTKPEEYQKLQQQRYIESQQREQALLLATRLQHLPGLALSSALDQQTYSTTNVSSETGQPSNSGLEKIADAIKQGQQDAIPTNATTDAHSKVCFAKAS